MSLTTTDLYGTPSLGGQNIPEEIVQASHFCRLSDISFDQLCQLYRQYQVKDDAGAAATAQEYGARFLRPGAGHCSKRPTISSCASGWG